MIKILVIDDDKLIRWSLTEIFSQEGYTVDAFGTVNEILKQVANTRYNLIFADLEINEETGIDIIKKIKESQPAAKIIILSALFRNQIETLLGKLAVYSIIEKPFKSEQIKSIAKDALGLTNLNKSRR